MINKALKYLAIAALSLPLVSCDSFFDIKPSDEMVLDEYWQNEGDVLAVTMECYRAMASYDYMKRLIVWGELRGDNVVVSPGNGDSDIRYIGNLNLLPSNGYTSWTSFYNVINLCNTVEHYAPIACELDPNFTQAQLNGYIAEVKGIRAFTYFTLVRAFRDVPFVTEPTIDDTQVFQIPQSDPDELIDYLIDDLKSVEGSAITSWSNTAYTKGRITQAAIRSLIADMCLWRERYEECVDYCDRILNDHNNPFMLENGSTFGRSVFITGNSNESIFELQMSSTTTYNGALSDCYGNSRQGDAMQMIPYDFETAGSTLFGDTDYRKRIFYYANSGATAIRKYVANLKPSALTASSLTDNDYEFYSTFERNWILYRLPDIYLMKAEALAEQGSNLEEAFRLATLTYDRANPGLGATSLNYAEYASQTAVLNFIFDERQREFMFEGKRYFDILRRISHHRTDFRNIVSSYLQPKYADLDQSTVASKLSAYDALFMPINSTEMRANLLLKQNPFYETSSDINLD
ncbi:MAG: RagB/SusD family nutrient uptake outer membrane protein [Bacteroides sp.]|nr:RagB/SusD family nutrient uptake outer membrane protein [Bacteroides sp.]